MTSCARVPSSEIPNCPETSRGEGEHHINIKNAPEMKLEKAQLRTVQSTEGDYGLTVKKGKEFEDDLVYLVWACGNRPLRNACRPPEEPMEAFVNNLRHSMRLFQCFIGVKEIPSSNEDIDKAISQTKRVLYCLPRCGGACSPIAWLSCTSCCYC